MKNLNLLLFFALIFLIGCSGNNTSVSVPNEMVGVWKHDRSNSMLLISTNSIKQLIKGDTLAIVIDNVITNNCLDCEKSILKLDNNNSAAKIQFYNFQSVPATIIYSSGYEKAIYHKL